VHQQYVTIHAPTCKNDTVDTYICTHVSSTPSPKPDYPVLLVKRHSFYLSLRLLQ